MIEKRYYVDVDEAIIDSKTRRQYTGVEDIADKLNELYTSNLAQGEIISKQIKQIETLENDYFSIRDIASELKKENEQLKKELKKYTDAFDCSQCRFQDYDWFDDGDEFEICKKGNNEAQMENHSCSEWEEL